MNELMRTHLKTNKAHQWVKRGEREVSPSMVSDMVSKEAGDMLLPRGARMRTSPAGRPVLLERKDRGQNRCANKAQGNPTVIFGGGPLRPHFVVPRNNFKGANERSFRRNDVDL